MKKTIVVLVMLTMAICMLSSTAFADDTVYSEGFLYYVVQDHSITVVGYFGDESEVVIPNFIAGDPVNAIGDNAFADSTVKILYLPDTIMEIGNNGTGSAQVVYADNSLNEAAMQVIASAAESAPSSVQLGNTPDSSAQTSGAPTESTQPADPATQASAAGANPAVVQDNISADSTSASASAASSSAQVLTEEEVFFSSGANQGGNSATTGNSAANTASTDTASNDDDRNGSESAAVDYNVSDNGTGDFDYEDFDKPNTPSAIDTTVKDSSGAVVGANIAPTITPKPTPSVTPQPAVVSSPEASTAPSDSPEPSESPAVSPSPSASPSPSPSPAPTAAPAETQHSSTGLIIAVVVIAVCAAAYIIIRKKGRAK